MHWPQEKASFNSRFRRAGIMTFFILARSNNAFQTVVRNSRSISSTSWFASQRIMRPQTFTFLENKTRNKNKNGFPALQMSSEMSSASLSRQPFKSPNNSPSDSDPSGENYSWNQVGLIQDLIDALEESSISFPTPIQRMAIPQILSGGNGIAFAAATGSGKTLAYLLPVIQLLKGQELVDSSDSTESMKSRPLRKNKRPRALVLAPTRELAIQILAVLKSLSHKAKFSSELLIGGEDYGKQRKRLETRPVDIVVATPGRFVKHMKEGHVFLGSVGYVVLDEVDTMLEQGFQADIAKVLHPMLYEKPKKGIPDLVLKENAPKVRTSYSQYHLKTRIFCLLIDIGIFCL